MKPYSHQQEIIDRNPHKHLLAYDTGTGKTFTALKLAEKNAVDCLIVVPKALKKQWEEAITPFKEDHKVITKEEFRKEMLESTYSLKDYTAIIVDEAHYFAGLKSKMSKMLMKFVRDNKPEYVWLLTATPYLSTPWNIYTLARYVGYDFGYKAWEQEFFYKINMGGRMIAKPKKGMEDRLAEYVDMFGTTVDINEVVTPPEQKHQIVSFPYHEYYDKRNEEHIKAIEHIVIWTKRHQIVNGILAGDEYNEPVIFEEDDKLEYIKEAAKKHSKLAVVCRYNMQIEKYRAALADDYHVLIITGNTPNRHEVVQEASQSERVIVLIQAACSEGYELPDFKHCIFASMSFSYKDFKQMCGRFLRINNMSETTFEYLTVENSIDNDVYKSIQNKQDFHVAIYKKG